MIFLGEFKGRGRRRDLWGSEKVGEKRSQSPQLSQRTQHSEWGSLPAFKARTQVCTPRRPAPSFNRAYYAWTTRGTLASHLLLLAASPASVLTLKSHIQESIQSQAKPDGDHSHTTSAPQILVRKFTHVYTWPIKFPCLLSSNTCMISLAERRKGTTCWDAFSDSANEEQIPLPNFTLAGCSWKVIDQHPLPPHSSSP